MKVDTASGLATDRSETVSVVRVPSATAATMTSPSLREAIAATLPSALVTVAVEGKQENAPAGGGGLETAGRGGGGGGGGGSSVVQAFALELALTVEVRCVGECQWEM